MSNAGGFPGTDAPLSRRHTDQIRLPVGCSSRQSDQAACRALAFEGNLIPAFEGVDQACCWLGLLLSYKFLQCLHFGLCETKCCGRFGTSTGQMALSLPNPSCSGLWGPGSAAVGAAGKCPCPSGGFLSTDNRRELLAPTKPGADSARSCCYRK